VRPMKILFWNVGARECTQALRAIVAAYAPEIVVLAESPQSEPEVVAEMNAAGPLLYRLTINHSERLQFFVAFTPTRFQPMHDAPGVAVRRVEIPLRQPVLLVALHLSSKLYLDEAEQTMLVTRVGTLIRRLEEQVGHKHTVVIGDLNMNPFEHGVVGSEGLHAVSTRAVAERNSRIVMGESRDFFYNPMWSLLGDDSPGPPGTYYYGESSPVSYFWNSYDQILLRPALAASYQPGDVTVLAEVGGLSLLDNRGHPRRDLADHLPILATVRLQEVPDATT
jgi:hypothetical protein